jgi:hypothetical protein
MAGDNRPSANVSSSAIQLPKFSASNPRHDSRRCTVVSLPLYKAQRRRAVLAAQAAARRRAVIAVILCLAGIVGAVLTVEREVQMQAREVRRG